VGLPTFLEPLGLPDLVFGAHWYDALYTMFGVGPDKDERRARLKEIVDLGRGWDVPVWIGEYGGVQTASAETVPHLKEDMDSVEELCVGAALWTYNPTDVDWNLEGTSLVSPGGGERPHVSAVVRPYPDRIAGTPAALSFDAAQGLFSFSFQAEPGVSGPTEIVVPERNYPAGFRVEADDGSWRWDATSRRLFYHTRQDGLTHSLRISPTPP
jgi:hypothetical protein